MYTTNKSAILSLSYQSTIPFQRENSTMLCKKAITAFFGTIFTYVLNGVKVWQKLVYTAAEVLFRG
jgi:hypothetical protein